MKTIVVVHNIRSLYNVGAILRTAEGFGVQKVIMSGYTPCADNPTYLPHIRERIKESLHKTALGAEESVEWSYYKETLDAVKALQDEGYTVYAVEQAHDSLSLEEVAEQISDFKFQISNLPKIAVVLGHEVFGVQQEVVDHCTQCIEIPQYGTKHSMNVSVTAGIVMYRLSEALRAVKKLNG